HRARGSANKARAMCGLRSWKTSSACGRPRAISAVSLKAHRKSCTTSFPSPRGDERSDVLQVASIQRHRRMAAALKVGLAGLGTVGSAVVAMLTRSREALAARAGRPIELVAYASKDPPKDNAIDVSRLRKVDEPVALARDAGIDVFVELMGGEGEPAKSSVEAALALGRPVVTANKALLAHHGASLAKLAEQHNATLSFEAAVAGGIPIVKTLREGLGGSRISRIYGILNGTCNYILTRMYRERIS